MFTVCSQERMHLADICPTSMEENLNIMLNWYLRYSRYEVPQIFDMCYDFGNDVFT